MSRERTTWNRTEIARTAGLKVADPYTMNQDHPQPEAEEYVIGDPASFGEDICPSNETWEAEYAGGQVKRNEIGMPEMRSDTFNHPERTASEDYLIKKAALCVAIARSVLSKTASSEELEDQSLAFMHLPDSAVMGTYTRLAQAQDQQDQEDQGQQDQGQQKKAQDQEDQGQQDQGQQKKAQDQEDQGQQDQGQQKKAQEQQDQGQEDQGQQKTAQGQQIAQLQQQAQQIQQQIAQLQQQQAQAQQQQAQAQCQGGCHQQQGQFQQQSQAQQVAQAVQQALAQGQDPVLAVQQVMQQGQQQAPVGQDSELIDAMLDQDYNQDPSAEMDIQMESPSMDVDNIQFGPEDDALTQLFASNAEVRMAQQAQGQDPDQDQGQQKQAHVIRTASMRTVGTRPTGGVSQIGGLPSIGSSQSGDKLAGIWNSAPDVSEAFGLPAKR
jgi:hypothetical protein